MAHGGARPNSGRKRGGTNKTADRRRRIKEAAIERAVGKLATPLEFLLETMRNPDLDMGVRIHAAARAAPYCHPKLTAIEHTGKDRGPIEVKQVSDIEAARVIGRLLQRVSAQGNPS
jgi:hypothetical protein